MWAFVTGPRPQKMHTPFTRYAPTVADEKQPKQKTPKGYEIPVPTRKSVFSFFEKVVRPKKG